MSVNPNHIVLLEQVRAVLAAPTSSSAQLKTAAETARGAVRAFDEALAAAPKRRVEVLAKTHLSVADIEAALAALDADGQAHARGREIAAAWAAALDARAHDTAKAEAIRDKAREPFAKQTHRAHEAAKAFSGYPTLAQRILVLLRSDIVVHRLAKIVYSNTPRQITQSLSREIRHEPPRVLAVVLESLRLPRIHNGAFEGWIWPRQSGGMAWLEAQFHEINDEEVVADIVAPTEAILKDMRNGRKPTEDDIDRAVARADAELRAEYDQICAAIEELLRLDAAIASEDCAAKYPDGATIFDRALFPNWMLRGMGSRIVLPALGPSAARAA